MHPVGSYCTKHSSFFSPYGMVAKILLKRWKHDRSSATKSSDVITGSADSLVAKVGTVCRVRLLL